MANVLSLDVVLGSICSALFFARVFDQPLNAFALLALGVSVWIIYTIDHILDGVSIKGNPTGKRHLFHKQHSHTFIIVLSAAILIEIILIFFLPGKMILRGFILLAVVGGYLFLHKRIGWLKELVIAALYTAGILVSSVNEFRHTQSDWMLVVSFLLIAFLNLMIFSWFDYENDISDGHCSIVTFVGKASAGILIWVTAALIMAILVYFGKGAPTVILGVMVLGHVMLYLLQNTLRYQERFRPIGEALFFLPLILLFP
jgi:4-hydroxybenzoate polyprenyltransferase